MDLVPGSQDAIALFRAYSEFSDITRSIYLDASPRINFNVSRDLNTPRNINFNATWRMTKSSEIGRVRLDASRAQPVSYIYRGYKYRVRYGRFSTEAVYV
jgi:hypothetical protein